MFITIQQEKFSMDLKVNIFLESNLPDIYLGILEKRILVVLSRKQFVDTKINCEFVPYNSLENLVKMLSKDIYLKPHNPVLDIVVEKVHSFLLSVSLEYLISVIDDKDYFMKLIKKVNQHLFFRMLGQDVSKNYFRQNKEKFYFLMDNFLKEIEISIYNLVLDYKDYFIDLAKKYFNNFDQDYFRFFRYLKYTPIFNDLPDEIKEFVEHINSSGPFYDIYAFAEDPFGPKFSVYRFLFNSNDIYILKRIASNKNATNHEKFKDLFKVELANEIFNNPCAKMRHPYMFKKLVYRLLLNLNNKNFTTLKNANLDCNIDIIKKIKNYDSFEDFLSDNLLLKYKKIVAGLNFNDKILFFSRNYNSPSHFPQMFSNIVYYLYSNLDFQNLNKLIKLSKSNFFNISFYPKYFLEFLRSKFYNSVYDFLEDQEAILNYNELILKIVKKICLNPDPYNYDFLIRYDLTPCVKEEELASYLSLISKYESLKEVLLSKKAPTNIYYAYLFKLPKDYLIYISANKKAYISYPLLYKGMLFNVCKEIYSGDISLSNYLILKHAKAKLLNEFYSNLIKLAKNKTFDEFKEILKR